MARPIALPPVATTLRDAGWLSEETEDDPARLGREEVWVVDPIDGTRAYLAGSPDWTISVALVISGRPVLGALYAPVTDELFLALAGKGATRNGLPIQTSPGDGLAGASFSGAKRRLDSLGITGRRIGLWEIRYSDGGHREERGGEVRSVQQQR